MGESKLDRWNRYQILGKQPAKTLARRQELERMWKRLEELQDVLKRGDYHPDAEARIQGEIRRLQDTLSPAEAKTSLYLRGRPEAQRAAAKEARITQQVRESRLKFKGGPHA